MSQPSLFEDLGDAPKPSPLKDPVERFLTIARDDRRYEAVVVRLADGKEHWVPRSVIRFDGGGPQTVQLERFKAEEIGL